MNRHLQIYLVAIMFVFLASCKRQNRTDQVNENIGHKKIVSLDNIHPILELDTISTPNAPSRITRKIRRDKEGNLLFAAYEDIIRYDGVSFTPLTKEEGLDSYDAFDALEDKKGNIWIASTHFGLFHHDGKSLTRFTTDDGLSHNRCMTLYEDKAGNIWIGGQGGASYYDGKSFRSFTTNEGLTNNDVNTIMEDKTGKIWFGTRGTACVYDPSSLLQPPGNAFTEIRNDQDIPFTNVWSIIEDQKGNIWIGGQDGLWRYNGFSFTNFTTEFVAGIIEDKKGNIWATSPNGILSRYDENTLPNEQATAIPILTGGGAFFGILEDEKGDIWVGTLNGVCRYDGTTVSYFKDNKAQD